MIFFSVLTIIFLIYYIKTYKNTGFSPLLIFLIASFFFSLFCYECFNRGLPFFFSDEIYYILGAEIGMQFSQDRFLWLFINNLVLHHDISFNGFMLKLINIPVAAGFLLILWHIFKNKKIFLLPIVLPYFSFVATKNLRDVPILFLSSLCIFIFFNRKSLYLPIGFLILGLLFLLRPFAAGIILIIILLQLCFLSAKPIFKLQLSKSYTIRFILIVLIGLLILPFFAPILKRSIVKNYAWFIYTTIGEGKDMKADSRVQSDPRYASGNISRDFFLASVRYAVTPIPTSLVKRAVKGGTEWGIVDDLIRIVNQVVYYFLLGYLIINARYVPKIFFQLTPARKAVILSLLVYWPIYSYHLYGVGHQRLKLPLQIAIFLMVLVIDEYKNNKRSVMQK